MGAFDVSLVAEQAPHSVLAFGVVSVIILFVGVFLIEW